MASKGYGVLIKEKGFMKLLCANIVNRFGDSVDALAFSWLVYELTGAAALMAVVVALNFLPTILLQPFTGVLADRMKKRTMMILCDLARALIVGLAGLLMLLGVLQTWMLLVMTVVMSILEAFRQPAGFAAMPMLLDKEHYSLGSGLNSSASQVATLVGTAAAGGIIALIGTGGALLVDAATFVISAAIICFIHFSEKEAEEKKENKFMVAFKQGIHAIWGEKTLRSLCMVGMILNFCTVGIGIFSAPYVKDSMGGEATLLSAMEIAITLGTILGAFIAPLVKTASPRQMILLGGLAMGIGFTATGALPWMVPSFFRLALLCAALLVMGVGVGMVSVTFSAAFMRHANPEMMGRLGGILNALLVAGVPIGSAVFSLLATALSVNTIFMLSGVAVIIIFVVTSRFNVFKQI